MMESPDDVFEFEGDITDYWTFTQIRDYVLMLPGLGHSALRLYLLLRSMIMEASYRPRGGLRRMSIDQLAWLLTDAKPVSISSVYELLKALEAADLVLPKDTQELEGAQQLKGKEKAAKGIARGFVVKDLPPATYTGWRNAWDKLDAYTPDWRENLPQPPTHENTTDASGRPVVRVRQLDADGKETVGQSSAPVSPEIEETPAAPAPASNSKGRKEKRAKKKETPAATGTGEVPEQRDGAAQDLQPVMEAFVTAHLEHVGSHPLQDTLRRVRREATALLTESGPEWTVDHVAKLAGQLPRLGYKSLTQHAEWNPPAAPKPQSGQSRRASGPPRCERHPAFAEGDCAPCRTAERQQSGREVSSGPARIDGAALLERARARQGQST